MLYMTGEPPPEKSPFPGMDPYLERHWPDVHLSLLVYAADNLEPQLPEHLAAHPREDPPKENTKNSSSPNQDPPVKRRIVIQALSAPRPITVIELVSPWEKQGDALTKYLRQRQQYVADGVKSRRNRLDPYRRRAPNDRTGRSPSKDANTLPRNHPTSRLRYDRALPDQPARITPYAAYTSWA
jgi:hypothetical protein